MGRVGGFTAKALCSSSLRSAGIRAWQECSDTGVYKRGEKVVPNAHQNQPVPITKFRKTCVPGTHLQFTATLTLLKSRSRLVNLQVSLPIDPLAVSSIDCSRLIALAESGFRLSSQLISVNHSGQLPLYSTKAWASILNLEIFVSTVWISPSPP